MTIVVTGATGNVGRPLVAELAAAGARVGRSPAHPDAAGFPAGVEVFGSAARRAAGRVCGVPQLPRAGRGPRRRGRRTRGAAGVTKLVALSAINADDDFSRQPSRFRGDRNKEVEQLAVDSGLAWVSLRPTVFATNFAGMWSAQIRAGDVVAGPYAAASTRADRRDRHRGGRGAGVAHRRTCRTADPADRAAGVHQRRAGGGHRRRPGSPAAIPGSPRRTWCGNGSSVWVSAPSSPTPTSAMLAETLDKPALVTHDVEKILGRPATPFAHWVSEHRDLFAN